MKQFLKKVESKILTKLFMRWIDDEWDLELIQMTKSLLTERENKINTLLHFGNRVEIKGFKRHA